MTSTQPATDWPDQPSFPGQTHVAAGPHDMANMYLSHHAFRRDLALFEAAVRHTPVGAADTWAALRPRWQVFAEVLHHHHHIEDVMMWPVLLRRCEQEGDADSAALLHAMEAEHELIDPSLAACADGFEAMTTHPCEDHRNALDVHVTTARQLLTDHLRHEETEAIPLIQRALTVEEWAASEEFAMKGVTLGLMVNAVPWSVEGLPAADRERLDAASPFVVKVIKRLFGGRFARRERLAFRYV